MSQPYTIDEYMGAVIAQLQTSVTELATVEEFEGQIDRDLKGVGVKAPFALPSIQAYNPDADCITVDGDILVTLNCTVYVGIKKGDAKGLILTKLFKLLAKTKFNLSGLPENTRWVNARVVGQGKTGFSVHSVTWTQRILLRC